MIYAQVTDDTDATTFASYYAQNTPRIVKNLFDTEGARLKEKRPAYEIDVSTVLSALALSREAFVDFCVLCGCDSRCVNQSSSTPSTSCPGMMDVGGFFPDFEWIRTASGPGAARDG